MQLEQRKQFLAGSQCQVLGHCSCVLQDGDDGDVGDGGDGDVPLPHRVLQLVSPSSASDPADDRRAWPIFCRDAGEGPAAPAPAPAPGGFFTAALA